MISFAASAVSRTREKPTASSVSDERHTRTYPDCGSWLNFSRGSPNTATPTTNCRAGTEAPRFTSIETSRPLRDEAATMSEFIRDADSRRYVICTRANHHLMDNAAGRQNDYGRIPGRSRGRLPQWCPRRQDVRRPAAEDAGAVYQSRGNMPTRPIRQPTGLSHHAGQRRATRGSREGDRRPHTAMFTATTTRAGPSMPSGLNPACGAHGLRVWPVFDGSQRLGLPISD